MSELTTIHMLRHGEVDNPSGELYGRQRGFHLTELGRLMAESVSDSLEGHDIRAIIASPLERAQETAAPTSRMSGMPIITDSGLIEAGNKFEGINVNRNRLILAKPQFWPWYINPFEPSWGEPYTHIVERFSGVIRKALDLAEGGEAVLVSHQLPIWTMRRFLGRKPLAHNPLKRECALCSLTSLTFVGHQLISVGYSEPAQHLLAAAKDVTPGVSAAAENEGI